MTNGRPGKARKKARKAIKGVDCPAPKERLQVAALPWRTTSEGLQILLVSSRDTGRWIIPKGWPMAGRTNSAAAAIEAIEEAGLLGVVSDEPIGAFSYVKRLARSDQPISVEVFSLRVVRQRENWREKDERTTQWFAAEEAGALVSDPELGELISQFAGNIRR